MSNIRLISAVNQEIVWSETEAQCRTESIGVLRTDDEYDSCSLLQNNKKHVGYRGNDSKNLPEGQANWKL